MTLCSRCGARMVRVHRALLQKLVYAERFSCSKCPARSARCQPYLAGLINTARFVFSRSSRCPRCESHDVFRAAKRERFEPLSSNPLSILQRLLGAPLKKCPACRTFFYDWRKARRRTAPGSPDPGSATQRSAVRSSSVARSLETPEVSPVPE